ncbi:MAG: Tfp pilus assembly protein PilF [Rhodospirillaceae bacterium]|nr:MAG: Tfp pilus assembly protein PilF [Rhodospirillaceae bacterium]
MNRSLATNPESIVAANNLAALIADHQEDRSDRLMLAFSHVKRFATATNPLQLDTLAWVHYRLGQFGQAPAAGAATHPNAVLHFHYGAVLLALGDVVEGRQLLEQITKEEFPGRGEARQLLDGNPPAPIAPAFTP